jgi:hypothetical protein
VPSRARLFTQATIDAAVTAAKIALRNPACKKLIAGQQAKDPTTLLKYLHRNGKLRIADIRGARALTQGERVGNQVRYGRHSTIFFDKYIFSGDPNVLGLTALLGADAQTARSVLILHELSHATAKNDYYHTAFGGDTDKMNKEIHKTCFEGK